MRRPMALSAALAAALAALAIGAPPVRADTRVASYCTLTGDYCQGIFRRPTGAHYFQLRTFSFRGPVRTCVQRRSRICRTRTLRPIGHGIFQVTIYWGTNYPNQGLGRYAVSWYWQSTKIGRTLYFTR